MKSFINFFLLILSFEAFAENSIGFRSEFAHDNSIQATLEVGNRLIGSDTDQLTIIETFDLEQGEFPYAVTVTGDGITTNPNDSSRPTYEPSLAFGDRYSQCFFQKLNVQQIENVVSQLRKADLPDYPNYIQTTCTALDGRRGSRIRLLNLGQHPIRIETGSAVEVEESSQ